MNMPVWLDAVAPHKGCLTASPSFRLARHVSPALQAAVEAPQTRCKLQGLCVITQVSSIE